MSFEFIKKLPTPEEIRNQYPLDAELQALKEKRDAEIRDVFTGKSDKFLAIIGPCSADNEDAVCDYLLRLRKVQEKIEDKVLIIPRVYTNKPRTTGEGYKGMVHQPDPEKKPNLLAGLIAIRKMHMRAIRESGFTCADEMLYPENYRYLSDLLSYVAVGARSVEDQQHRLTVSGMDVPAGMKSKQQLTQKNSVKIASDPRCRNYKNNGENTDENAGNTVDQTEPRFSKSLQDAGEHGVCIKKRTDKRQIPYVDSGSLAVKKQCSEEWAKKKESASA